ncbi:hypothetical protein Ancab_032031, partial [Ancistrocladus abbreviatus]
VAKQERIYALKRVQILLVSAATLSTTVRLRDRRTSQSCNGVALSLSLSPPFLNRLCKFPCNC